MNSSIHIVNRLWAMIHFRRLRAAGLSKLDAMQVCVAMFGFSEEKRIARDYLPPRLVPYLQMF